jgi:hypothetical protein
MLYKVSCFDWHKLLLFLINRPATLEEANHVLEFNLTIQEFCNKILDCVCTSGDGKFRFHDCFTKSSCFPLYGHLLDKALKEMFLPLKQVITTFIWTLAGLFCCGMSMSTCESGLFFVTLFCGLWNYLYVNALLVAFYCNFHLNLINITSHYIFIL